MQYHSKNLLLEEYKFVPNDISVSLKDSITINMQIALEINYRKKIKIIEIADTPANHYKPLLSYVTDSLSRTPAVEMESILLTQGEVSIPNVMVENKDIQNFENVYMILGNNLLQTLEILNQAFNVLLEDGFIISRESLSNCISYSNVNFLTIHSTPSERLVLIKKPKYDGAYKTLQICNDFHWIRPLQEMLQMNHKVIIYSHLQRSGILGFTNCIRREGNTVRCFYICEEDAPRFDMQEQFYREQLEKGHAVNVFKNGIWGTYRCLPIDKTYIIKSKHNVYGSVRREGFQSFRWFVGPLITESMLNDDQSLVYVSFNVELKSNYYSF